MFSSRMAEIDWQAKLIYVSYARNEWISLSDLDGK
jgi:hypothetical protein